MDGELLGGDAGAHAHHVRPLTFLALGRSPLRPPRCPALAPWSATFRLRGRLRGRRHRRQGFLTVAPAGSPFGRASVSCCCYCALLAGGFGVYRCGGGGGSGRKRCLPVADTDTDAEAKYGTRWSDGSVEEPSSPLHPQRRPAVVAMPVASPLMDGTHGMYPSGGVAWRSPSGADGERWSCKVAAGAARGW